MVTVFLADGFEEMEAVVPIDILRRGGVAVRTCSITDSRRVIGAHQIPFEADFCIGELTKGRCDFVARRDARDTSFETVRGAL